MTDFTVHDRRRRCRARRANRPTLRGGDRRLSRYSAPDHALYALVLGSSVLEVNGKQWFVAPVDTDLIDDIALAMAAID